MTNVISQVVLTNLAFNDKDPKEAAKKVEISRTIDDRYLVCIKIGDWTTKIAKEDLARVL